MVAGDDSSATFDMAVSTCCTGRSMRKTPLKLKPHLRFALHKLQTASLLKASHLSFALAALFRSRILCVHLEAPFREVEVLIITMLAR